MKIASKDVIRLIFGLDFERHLKMSYFFVKCGIEKITRDS